MTMENIRFSVLVAAFVAAVLLAPPAHADQITVFSLTTVYPLPQPQAPDGTASGTITIAQISNAPSQERQTARFVIEASRRETTVNVSHFLRNLTAENYFRVTELSRLSAVGRGCSESAWYRAPSPGRGPVAREVPPAARPDG